MRFVLQCVRPGGENGDSELWNIYVQHESRCAGRLASGSFSGEQSQARNPIFYLHRGI